MDRILIGLPDFAIKNVVSYFPIILRLSGQASQSVRDVEVILFESRTRSGVSSKVSHITGEHQFCG